MNARTYSFRFGEQVLNSMLILRKEIDSATTELPQTAKSSVAMNESIETTLQRHRWLRQPKVLSGEFAKAYRLDFLKDHVGVEVQFGHASFIGIDLLKLHLASYAGTIDVGVYITMTSQLQKSLIEAGHEKWRGRLTFEKVVDFLELSEAKSAIHVPLLVVGLF